MHAEQEQNDHRSKILKNYREIAIDFSDICMIISSQTRVDLNLNGKSWTVRIFRRGTIAAISSEQAEMRSTSILVFPEVQWRLRRGSSTVWSEWGGIVSIGYYFRIVRNRACATKSQMK